MLAMQPAAIPLPTSPTEYSHSSPNQARLLYSLHIIRRHTLHHSTSLNLCPSVTWVLLDKHKPLTLSHTMLSVTASRILIKRFDVFELLRSAFRRDGWPLLLGYAA